MDLTSYNQAPKSLDLDALVAIYETIKSNKARNYDYHILSSLKKNSLEDLTHNNDIKKLMQKKYYTIKSLALLPHELNSEFCCNYLNNLLRILHGCHPGLQQSTAVQILTEIFSTLGLQKKLHVLQTITLCLAEGEINFDVFENFLPNEWRTELLLFNLFEDKHTDKDAIERVINNVNRLRTQENKGIDIDTEEVLEILLASRSEYEFNIAFIDDVLYMIPDHPEVKFILHHNISGLENKINEIKMMELTNCFKECNTSDINYFLKYPFDVIQSVTHSGRKHGTSTGFKELKNILEISDITLVSQINILRGLTPTESLSQWKYEFSFKIVKNIIQDIFSSYELYCGKVNKNEKALKIISLVSTSTVQCSCATADCVLHCTSECCDLLYALNSTIARVLFNCSHLTDKVVQTAEMIILGINSAKKICDLINALETLEDFNVQLSDNELYTLFSEFEGLNCDRIIHKHFVQSLFPGTYEKSTDELLREIQELNGGDGIASRILNEFLMVNSCYESKSVIMPTYDDIKSWSRNDVMTWAKAVRENNVSNNISVSDGELLAVIKRVAVLTVGLKIRDVQLLTILIMINCNKGKGKLAQVNTGEGKTLIIATLAAYYVLRGHTVDIYTSSPVLAVPQSKQFNEFYETCGLTVAHNIGPRCDYKCDVIYGTNTSFQGDVLRDEFRKSGIRSGRKFDVAIVDEVDNMLIDSNNWILMLSCDMPAMDHLEVILAAIYIQVKEAASCLVERDGQTCYLLEENAIDDEGKVKPEIIVQEIPIKESKKEFITSCTENHIRKLLRDTESCGQIEENYPEIKVPKHLREVILKVHLRKWVENAISAIFYYVKDEDYILRNGKVTIVDADNTGVIKSSSHWSAGLHQFLEIKHGARVSPESFTTNFISNVGLFTRYTSKLFGLTGTLGGDETKVFLKMTYEVDSVVIPPFKLKQHHHLKALIAKTTDDQYIEIAKSCIRQLKNGRAALIIMKYIREAEELAELFTKTFNYSQSKIKLFKTDDDSDVVDKPLHSGDVIITTNIAGRGTDIKLSKNAEISGGLHVCLGFLPKNTRVEHQNIGRTSRKGNRGTSQFVLCNPEFTCLKTLKTYRDLNEFKTMKGQTKTVKRVKIKDKIFKKFCDLLEDIKGRNTTVKKIEMSAVEERFAIWLLLNQDYVDQDELISAKFTEFRAEILKDDKEYSLIKNPYMYVNLGNMNFEKNKFDDAVCEYTKAIDLDVDFGENAYFNRAWAYLKHYGHRMNEYGHFINKAINDLEISRKLIENKEYSLHLLQTAAKGNVFSEQISHKLNLYCIQKNIIDLAIGPDVLALDSQIKSLEKDLKDGKCTEENKNKISEVIESLEERKKDIGIIRRAKKNKRNIKVEPLGDNFMPKSDQDSHKNEIVEFQRNGWIGGFTITEIKPINWGQVLSLIGIGLGQLLIGAALTVFSLGAGATIGMSFISEGVSDIITAVKDGIINRDFDWATWALMKVISITVSIVCAGFKAIKDAAKTAYAGAKNVVVSGTKAFTQTAKHGWKLAAKKIGLDLAKGIAKDIVTDLVTYGIDKTALPMLEEMIIESVRDPIQQMLLNNSKIAYMLQLDIRNNNNNYENKIRLIATELLNPEKNSKLKSLATQIATRVADNKGFAMTRQILTGVIGATQLVTFTSDFIAKMNEKIDHLHIENKECDGTNDCNTLNEENGQTQQEQNFAKSKDEDIDLNKAGMTQEQVTPQKKINNTDNLSIELAGMVFNNMLNILKNKIIYPVTQMGVYYTVDKISSRVNESLNSDLENYRSLKNVIHYQSKTNNNKTFDSKKSQKIAEKELKKVDEIIDKVKNGGPAGLAHLGAVSSATDRPIEVYDEKGRLKFTIGDSKQTPIQVQYHEPKNNSEIGHFTLKGCREPHKVGAANNMCLFNVVAEQTGHDPNDLKKESIKIMENNKSTLAKQVQHINRLEMYDKSSLHEGGAQYNGKYPDHAKHFLRNANGVAGFGYKNPGHSDIHIPFKGKTIDKLNAVAEETGREIHVYDKKGNLSYIVGQQKGTEGPIKLDYYKPKGDTSAECFSSRGGNEIYYINDPNDMHFYNIISKQTGRSAESLKTATQGRIDLMKIPKHEKCIENESIRRPKKPNTGFVSEDEQAFVLHHALQTETAKTHMEELNKYKRGVNESDNYTRRQVYISAEELNLPRSAYGGRWEKGKLTLSWPVTDVMIVLQHYDGPKNTSNSQNNAQQNNSSSKYVHRENNQARVHIETFFPYPPK